MTKLSQEQSYNGSLAIARFQGMKVQIHSQIMEAQCHKTQQKRPMKSRRHTSRQQSGSGGHNNIHFSVHMTNTTFEKRGANNYQSSQNRA
ncbi:hypothetical protein PoB_007124700 [Plakobranchus ocellatus]|uniref:Uncharacterized protein n=1 Tax=Plakobranchus ocellatus TaxID=259542 RepID=A0AAV4DKD6_9GAST|nr:hypothetical protein PoB_007124700 [Plakobranchus ocellatus]